MRFVKADIENQIVSLASNQKKTLKEKNSFTYATKYKTNNANKLLRLFCGSGFWQIVFTANLSCNSTVKLAYII